MADDDTDSDSDSDSDDDIGATLAATSPDNSSAAARVEQTNATDAASFPEEETNNGEVEVISCNEEACDMPALNRPEYKVSRMPSSNTYPRYDLFLRRYSVWSMFCVGTRRFHFYCHRCLECKVVCDPPCS